MVPFLLGSASLPVVMAFTNEYRLPYDFEHPPELATGEDVFGHQIGSPVSMISAASCVASGSTVPVLLITTIGVSVAEGELVSVLVSAGAGVSDATAVAGS
jgi:hypothetical protein